MADLLTAMNDIAAYKGELCNMCRFYGFRPRPRNNGRFAGSFPLCQKGYDPAGPEDGCDDWQPRQHSDSEVA